MVTDEKNEDIKTIYEWLFLLGGVFILIGILDLIVLLSSEVEFNVFLISNIWCLGFLLLGLISITGGAIVYTINLLFYKIDKELRK
ncbi:MAG: hypothetical protein MUP85_01830 [Candidatus Lokiarchaeota archaeon]|nr:hypothetical protein [Candidatus Lokiarchaeota archaeon]